MKTGCRIHEEGFTLIEVMIALVIFSVGILGIGQMQLTSIQGNDSAHEISTSVAVAKDKINSLMTLPYSDPDLADGVSGTEIVNWGSGNEKYIMNWVITEGVPIDNVKQISVNVTWDDNGISRSLSVNYYRAVEF